MMRDERRNTVNEIDNACDSLSSKWVRNNGSEGEALTGVADGCIYATQRIEAIAEQPDDIGTIIKRKSWLTTMVNASKRSRHWLDDDVIAGEGSKPFANERSVTSPES
jgi:hypothetical protein